MRHQPLVPDDLSLIFTALPDLVRAWPGGQWVWDPNFDCAVCTCPAECAADVRSRLLDVMAELYDHARIVDAPEAILEVVRDTNGVRSGQYVFAGAPVRDQVPFGLWWWWKDGSQVSIRVGLRDRAAVVAEEPHREAPGWAHAPGGDLRADDLW